MPERFPVKGASHPFGTVPLTENHSGQGGQSCADGRGLNIVNVTPLGLGSRVAAAGNPVTVRPEQRYMQSRNPCYSTVVFSIFVGAGSTTELSMLYGGPVAKLKRARAGVMLALTPRLTRPGTIRRHTTKIRLRNNHANRMRIPCTRQRRRTSTSPLARPGQAILKQQPSHTPSR